MRIPKIAHRPTLEQFLTMEATGSATQMVKISNFTQEQPTDGAQATQRTDVYLGYDNRAFYAVWVCFDTNPARGARAHEPPGKHLRR